MWTDQWDSGEVDHVIVMIMQDEDSMSEACHRQSLVPELNGPQLGTRFLPLLSKCVTNSPVHPLIKCCWQAQWCPAYQEQLGVQGLKNTSTQVDQTAILGIRGRPSVPPAETACLQNNKGSFSGRRFSGCAHPPLVVFLLTA